MSLNKQDNKLKDIQFLKLIKLIKAIIYTYIERDYMNRV